MTTPKEKNKKEDSTVTLTREGLDKDGMMFQSETLIVADPGWLEERLAKARAERSEREIALENDIKRFKGMPGWQILKIKQAEKLAAAEKEKEKEDTEDGFEKTEGR
jgi:hypothetical protein